MIIECPYCESKVDAEVRGFHTESSFDDLDAFKVSLLKCSACSAALLAGQAYTYCGSDNYEKGAVIRLWPIPDKYLDWNLPDIVRQSLEEAMKCYKAKAYIACAVMCGRAIEAICVEHKTKSKDLFGGLKELLKRKIIDEKIHEWSETLREHRNISAHATNKKTSKQDAKDLLDFSNAICDYVFILTVKFEDFKKRNPKKSK